MEQQFLGELNTPDLARVVCRRVLRPECKTRTNRGQGKKRKKSSDERAKRGLEVSVAVGAVEEGTKKHQFAPKKQKGCEERPGHGRRVVVFSTTPPPLIERRQTPWSESACTCPNGTQTCNLGHACVPCAVRSTVVEVEIPFSCIPGL